MDYLRTDAISDKCSDEDISEGFSEPQGSVLWSKRSLLYRFSFLALLPLFAVFLLGFSSPFWMKKHQVDKYRGYYNIREKVDVSIGIWRVCEGSDFWDITDCTDIPDVTNYIVICQVMLCLCLIFIVSSLIFGFYENCATRYDIDEGSEVRTKRPEMNAVIAGLFGLTGICMYGTSIIDATRNGEGSVHWAFLVTTGSVLGVIVCGIIMAIVNPVHSTVETFPEQVISISRQNSLKNKPPTIQDRLLTSGECIIQINGAQTSGTTYGVTDSNFDLKEVALLQGSESSLTSNVSTPDRLPAASRELDPCSSNTGTHVVDTRDIHAMSLKVELMQQQKRAANSRSWQCDPSLEPNIVSDLFDNTFDDILTSDTSSYSDNENFKLLEHSSQASKFRPSEPVDLMILEEFLEKATANEHIPAGAMAEETLLGRRPFNNFLEDSAIAMPPVLNELQRSTVSNSSWASQPWPEPPPENEILDQPLVIVPTNRSLTPDASASSCSDTRLKTSTERLQCLPQTQTAHYRKLTPDEDSNLSFNTQKPSGSKSNSSKGNQITPPPKPTDKKSSPSKAQAAVRKDYDNPLFQSQQSDGSKSDNKTKNPSVQICQPSALVQQPSDKTSIPSLTAPEVSQGKTESRNYNTTVDTARQTIEASEGRKRDSNRPPQVESKTSSPKLNRFSKKSKDDLTSSLLKETPSANKDQYHLINGVVKSRLLHLKDEIQQKRAAKLSSEQPQQPSPPPSKKQEQKDTSSQTASKLPRLNPPKKTTPESKDNSKRSKDEAKGQGKTLIPDKHKQRDSKSSKQLKKK